MSHIARLSLVERYACYTGSALLSKIFLFAAFQIWIIRTAQKPGRQRRCIFVLCFKSLTAPNLFQLHSDIGCSAEDEDGTTAYTQALLYWITGNSAYAQNAITILNAYGHNLKSYTDSNGPLQAAWGA